MHMALPNGTLQISDARSPELKVRNFDDQKVAFFKDHIYKNDRLLLYYTYVTVPPGLRKSLENRQEQLVSLSKQKEDRTVDGSRIITCNNIRYLIINYHEGAERYVWFSSDYDKAGNYINGFVQYAQADKNKANRYLSSFLSTLGFNNN